MNLKTVSQYLFLAFLFVLPLQTVYLLREPFVGGVKWEYGVIGIYFTDLLFLGVLGLFLASLFWDRNCRLQIADCSLRRLWYRFFNLKSEIINHKSEALLASFLLWSGLSIFWSSDQILASYFFVKLLLAVGLFWMVRYRNEFDLKKIVFVFLAAGVIQSGIGITQFLSQESVGSSILGMSAHEAFQAGSSVLKIDSGRFLRAYGTFSHPNVLGGFLGAVLVFVVGFFSSVIPTSEPESKVFLSGSRIKSGMTIGGIIIILLGLILTFSRAAWLGSLLGIVFLGVFVFRQKEREIRGRFLKMLAALGLAGMVFGSILSEQIFPRFDTATIEREGSVSERVASLRDARSLIAEHPLVGVGAGNFTAEILEREKGDKKGEMGERGKDNARPVWSIQPAHNVFVLIWSELGVVGFLLFIGFLASLLFSVLQSAICNPKSAILIVLIPSLFLDHFLWSSHFGLLFFFLLLGFASRR